MSKHTFESRSWHGPVARGLLLVGACALPAAEDAQTTQDKHHLIAIGGNPFQSDNEIDRFDGRAEFAWQDGVQGVNPSFFFHEAVADGDSGLLSIFSRFSLAGGAGDPISVASDNRSVAVIEDSVDPDFLSSGPVTFTARLNWGGAALAVTAAAVLAGLASRRQRLQR